MKLKQKWFTEEVHCYVTPEFKAEIDAMAKFCGMGKSQFIRIAIGQLVTTMKEKLHETDKRAGGKDTGTRHTLP